MIPANIICSINRKNIFMLTSMLFWHKKSCTFFTAFLARAFFAGLSELTLHILLFIIFFTVVILGVYNTRLLYKRCQNLYYREELFDCLCSKIDEVYIIYDIEKHTVEYCSPNSERILGISNNIIKKNPRLLLDYSSNKFKEQIINLYKGKIHNNAEMEFVINHPVKHEACSLVLHIYPILANNKILRYITSISDLTRAKQSQQILKDALMSAQKANEAKKDFLSLMSHEIKTPINIILGMTKIAVTSINNKEKLKNCLNKITEASNNLLSFVNNILDMVKIDSQKLLLSNEPFDLKAYLDNYASLINSHAELNQLDFELETSEFHNSYISGDSQRLTQILNNCIFNSIKFTPSGGTIKLKVNEIEMYDNKGRFRFIIIDNGKGMSKEYLERIFIPFEQEDSNIARKYGGSGLGMSITKNLVTLMGGTIDIKSTFGIGTTVTIDLTFNVPEDNTQQNNTEEKNSKQSYSFAGHRILAVEDNEINLEIICEILKSINILADTAANGHEAFELFNRSCASFYDIILMDIEMPDLNGYEAAKMIRNSKHPDASKVSIIAMSADSYAKDRSAFLESGMNYYITKPIEINKLIVLLKEILKEPKIKIPVI